MHTDLGGTRGDWYTPEGYPRKPLQAHFSSLTDMCLALVAIPRSKHSLEGENTGVYSSYCYDADVNNNLTKYFTENI